MTDHEIVKKSPLKRLISVVGFGSPLLFGIISATLSFSAGYLTSVTRDLNMRLEIAEKNASIQTLRASEILLRSTTQIDKEVRNIRERIGGTIEKSDQDEIVASLTAISKISKILSDFARETKDDLSRPTKKSLLISPFSPAYAETASDTPHRYLQISSDDVRLIGMITILAVLGFGFFVAIGIVMFTKNDAAFNFAADTVKMLLGFFIGVATSFFGAMK